jgi:methyltransferase
MCLQENTRVTIKLDQTDFQENIRYYTGKVVSQDEPFIQTGTYWGYNVRVAGSIRSVFDECPYEGGYDIKLGTSDKGRIIDFESFSDFKDFKHALIFFGGLEGIEGIIE